MKYPCPLLALISFVVPMITLVGEADHNSVVYKLTDIPALMQAFVDRDETPGVVTLAAHKGEIISLSAVGSQSLDPKVPMQKDSIFWAASLSKPFVAVAIMMLVEEGKLQLDDPVENHLPEFKGIQMTVPDYDIEAREIKLVEPRRPITIQDCLNHTHGLPLTSSVDEATSIRAHAIASSRSTLDWEPGSKWRYGGEGLHIVAYLVELYSGMSYADFLKKRIFEPLGMNNTYFMRNEVPKDRLVERYWKDKQKQVWTTKQPDIRDRPYFRPDGGLYSTANDFFRFYQMMLNEGTFNGTRLIKEKSVTRLTTITCGHLKKGDHIAGCFTALGFRIVREAIDEKTKALNPGSFGHGGSGGSIIWADPKTEALYIYLRNNNGPNLVPMVETFQQVVSDAVR